MHPYIWSMKKYVFTILYIIISLSGSAQSSNDWMKKWDFVFLDTLLEYAHYDVRYAGTYNFVGDTITGYECDRLVMTRASAIALKKAEQSLAQKGYGLKIFDAYRPQRAVDHFKSWADEPADTLTKHIFYPDLNKKHLHQLGYISSRSGHSRGSTVDLTLYRLSDGKEVDMGAPYDFFGEISHHTYTDLSKDQLALRSLLKEHMNRANFRPYSKEWWHYTLREEPHWGVFLDEVVH